MDRISTSTKALDLFGAGKHGFKDGNLGSGILPTDFNAAWVNALQEEVLAIIETAGIAPSAGTMNQVMKGLKRLYGGNLRIITAAGPTVLTVDDAGLVLIDATANAVAITLPAVNVVTGAPLLFEFVRIDAVLANAVTISRAGADTFVGGATTFALSTQNDFRSVMGDSTSKWVTTSQASTGGQQAGEICYFARNSAPTGFLKANGAAVSRVSYAQLFAALCAVSVVTISNAAPGVVTWTAHGRVANDPVKFATTGALPAPLVAGTTYYVYGPSIAADVFQISSTPGGAAITTTTAGSGTQTATFAPFGSGDGTTTFNLPELRGEFVRSWDDGRSVDPVRVFGSGQAEDFKSHIHGVGTTTGPSGAAGYISAGAGTVSYSTATGGTETRPRNIAMLACIKY